MSAAVNGAPPIRRFLRFEDKKCDARLLVAMVILKKGFMAPQLHSSVTRLPVYHTYRRVSGEGADGRVKGVNGSINPLAVFCMLMAMKVGGRTVFGCSEGRFLLSAALQGARKAIGVEFPENILVGYQYLFDADSYAVRKSMQRSYGVLPAE